MSFSNTLENDLLLLLFNNTPISLVGDTAGISGSVATGSLFMSLHTSSPGEAGNQSTNESVYTGYARKSVSRNVSGWTITANSVSPTSNIDFGECVSGTETITHFGVGTSLTGSGKLLFYGSLSSSIAVSSGVIPRILSTSTISLD